MDIQLIIAVVTVAASAGIAWGIAQNKLKALEIRLAIVESEHKSDYIQMNHDDVDRHIAPFADFQGVALGGMSISLS
jgi:hypothetical protein